MCRSTDPDVSLTLSTECQYRTWNGMLLIIRYTATQVQENCSISLWHMWYRQAILRRKLKMRNARLETEGSEAAGIRKGGSVGPLHQPRNQADEPASRFMQQSETLCTTWSKDAKGIPTSHVMHGLYSKMPGDFILYFGFHDEMKVRDDICCLLHYTVLSPHPLSTPLRQTP